MLFSYFPGVSGTSHLFIEFSFLDHSQKMLYEGHLIQSSWLGNKINQYKIKGTPYS